MAEHFRYPVLCTYAYSHGGVTEESLEAYTHTYSHGGVTEESLEAYTHTYSHGGVTEESLEAYTHTYSHGGDRGANCSVVDLRGVALRESDDGRGRGQHGRQR